MELAEKIANNSLRYGTGSYCIEGLTALANGAFAAPSGGHVLEIGSEYGRSTTTIIRVAQEKNWFLTCVDPFVNEEGKAGRVFMNIPMDFGIHMTLHYMTTAEAYERKVLPESLVFTHIDGDHTEAGVTLDCEVVLPRLVSGGIAAFHDYGYHDAPDVRVVVDKYTAGWETIQNAGTCMVRRKP